MNASARASVPTFKLMLGIVRFAPWRYAGNAILWTLVWVMPVIPGLISKEFFDGLTGEASVSFGVDTLIAFMAAYGLGRVALVAVAMLNDVYFRFRVGSLLRRNMIGRILSLPGARAVPDSPGEAISRFRDEVEHVEEAVDLTVDMVGTVAFSTVAVVVLASINAQITLFVFAPLVLVILIAERAGTRIRIYRQAAREATGRVTGAIGEMFGSVQSIKVGGAEHHMIGNFRVLNEARRKVMVRDRVLNSILESVFWNTVNIGTAIILVLAAGAMQSSGSGAEFTVGDFALFVYFLTFATDAVHFVGIFIARFRQAGVAFERMAELLQGAPPETLVVPRDLELRGAWSAVAPPPDRGTLQSLEVKGLSYTYPGSDTGIEKVDLQVARGSFTVVTGRIGSGKTTLLRALLGLLKPDTGEVRWNGRIVDDAASFFVPPRTAYTPQIPRLFSMSLKDNLLMGLERSDDEVAAAIASAVMEPDLAAMAEGLDTKVGPLGVRLSGGQVQRTAAARMFIRRPELYVFDDLSSALDVETENTLWERLFADHQVVTSLVVSHRRPALRRADQIIVMNEGRIEAVGTLSELLVTSEELRRLWSEEPGEDNGANSVPV
ncbi:MAG: ABC transporter ATP-binding protein/permease [Acidimicrobiia bacterium]|nr:ABC transporter ATP-binding protein/permease [Acidimicrobiia bacterium]MDH3397971.1 ABC transporter ATP-binding protein/permease [Acidimicrobiia bacterium]